MSWLTRAQTWVPLVLLGVFVSACLVGSHKGPIYPDEFVDADNAILILRQEQVRAQVNSDVNLKLFGRVLPIYGIRPYNGAGLSYLMAVYYAVFGISITTLKMASLVSMTVSLILLYWAFRLCLGWKLALMMVVLFAWEPFYIHYTKCDYGPLRAILPAFCLHLYYVARVLYGRPLGKVEGVLWAGVAGFGLYNHIVFVIPLLGLAVVLVLSRQARERALPRSLAMWPAVVGAFALGMWPYFFDLPGLVEGYARAAREILGGKGVEAAAQREAFEGGLTGAVRYRFGTLLCNRSRGVFHHGFGGDPQAPTSAWSLFLLTGLGVALIVGAARGIWRVAARDRGEPGPGLLRDGDAPLLVALAVMLAASMLFPLMSTAHHHIYGQVYLSLACGLLLARLLAAATRPALFRLAGAAILAGFLVTVAANTRLVREYLHCLKRHGTQGLWSGSITDLKYPIEVLCPDRTLVSYGWGMHSYALHLFGGERPFRWYRAPADVNPSTCVLVSIAADGKIRAEPPLSPDEFARQHGVQLERVYYRAATHGYSPYALLTFRPEVPQRK